MKSILFGEILTLYYRKEEIIKLFIQLVPFNKGYIHARVPLLATTTARRYVAAPHNRPLLHMTNDEYKQQWAPRQRRCLARAVLLQ